MYCKIVNSLYVKANGEIPCLCATGEDKILYRATNETDFMESVLFGDKYNYIRDSLRGNKLPWEFCNTCLFLEKDKPFSNPLVDKRRIDHLQIEPSYLCQLDCDACFPSKNERKKVKAPPHNMPLELFRKVIYDIREADITFGEIEFQGRGEPLMNKDVWKMTAYTREKFPESGISVYTNGNFTHNSESVQAGLSGLVVSVDGCYQDTYKIYRKGGNIDMAFRFMEDFVKENKRYNKKVEVIWKYLLFGHNDSDQELVDAQKKALDLGIDVLMFQTTPWVYNCKHSRFYKNKNADFPRIDLVASSLKVISPNGGCRNESLDTVYEELMKLYILLKRNRTPKNDHGK